MKSANMTPSDGSTSSREVMATNATANIHMTGMAGIEVRFGSLVFTSKFDSGNLARVEKVCRDDDLDQDISMYL